MSSKYIRFNMTSQKETTHGDMHIDLKKGKRNCREGRLTAKRHHIGFIALPTRESNPHVWPWNRWWDKFLKDIITEAMN